MKLSDRSQERDSLRTVEQIVYNQVPQIQERIVKGCGRSGPNHPKILMMKMKKNKLEELKVIIVVEGDAEYIKKSRTKSAKTHDTCA